MFHLKMLVIVAELVCNSISTKQVKVVSCVRPFLSNGVSFLKASLKNDQKSTQFL